MASRFSSSMRPSAFSCSLAFCSSSRWRAFKRKVQQQQAAGRLPLQDVLLGNGLVAFCDLLHVRYPLTKLVNELARRRVPNRLDAYGKEGNEMCVVRETPDEVFLLQGQRHDVVEQYRGRRGDAVIARSVAKVLGDRKLHGVEEKSRVADPRHGELGFKGEGLVGEEVAGDELGRRLKHGHEQLAVSQARPGAHLLYELVEHKVGHGHLLCVPVPPGGALKRKVVRVLDVLCGLVVQVFGVHACARIQDTGAGGGADVGQETVHGVLDRQATLDLLVVLVVVEARQAIERLGVEDLELGLAGDLVVGEDVFPQGLEHLDEEVGRVVLEQEGQMGHDLLLQEQFLLGIRRQEFQARQEQLDGVCADRRLGGVLGPGFERVSDLEVPRKRGKRVVAGAKHLLGERTAVDGRHLAYQAHRGRDDVAAALGRREVPRHELEVAILEQGLADAGRVGEELEGARDDLQEQRQHGRDGRYDALVVNARGVAPHLHEVGLVDGRFGEYSRLCRLEVFGQDGEAVMVLARGGAEAVEEDFEGLNA
ncbi:hypothetical protein HYQ46_004537 [Verticillium longisporum]|nr:hypothetical protein HYQ46_004537 [Verticillium longisporum]